MLACSNLRLHKLASNDKEVIDHASDPKYLDLAADNLIVQQQQHWVHLDLDSMGSYHVINERKPFTRQGVFSRVN